MPIILLWNAAALPFERQVKRWLKELEGLGAQVGKALAKRLAAAEKMERKSRAFPVVLFYNLALTARLSPFQRGALVPGGPPGLGDSFARIGAAWNLPEIWHRRQREAQLLPRLFAALSRITRASRASVARLRNAPPSMFTPGNLTAVDLVGLASLTFRSVGQGRAGILAAGQRLHTAIFGADSSARQSAEAAGGADGALPMAMQLDNLLRKIAAGILIIPVVSRLLPRVFGDVLLWLRHAVMAQIVAVERKVLDFRQDLLGRINTGLQEFAYVAVGLLVILRDQATDLMRHYILFSAAYVDGLTQGITIFFDQLRTFWSGIRRIIRGTMDFLTQLSRMDLGPLLHAVFVALEEAIDDIHFVFHGIFGPDKFTAPNVFPVPLGDLVMNRGNGPRAHENLQNGVNSLNASIEEITFRGFYIGELEDYLRESRGLDIDVMGVVRGIRDLLPHLQQDPVNEATLPPRLMINPGDMPDIEVLFLQPARQAIMTGLNQGGLALRQGAETLNVSILDFLGSTAVTFAAAADDAATSDLGTRVPRLHAASEAEVLAQFPAGQLRSSSTGLEPLAAAYAQWFVRLAPNAGMSLIGAVTSEYLLFVLEEWDLHLAANQDTPVAVTETSPRILLERAQLARVHMPRMVIQATGQETDTQLAQRIAEEFRDEVSTAYATGLARLQGFAAAASAREAAAANAPTGPAATAAPAGGGPG